MNLTKKITRDHFENFQQEFATFIHDGFIASILKKRTQQYESNQYLTYKFNSSAY